MVKQNDGWNSKGRFKMSALGAIVFFALFGCQVLAQAQNGPPANGATANAQPNAPTSPAVPPDLPPPPSEPSPGGSTGGALGGSSGETGQPTTIGLEGPSPVPEPPKRPGARDPFAKPKSLLDREAEANRPVIDPAVYIDSRIEPIRRWPLRSYRLVAIIFDVENPKAMIKDPEGTMHLVSRSQRIGNQEGVITAIERGEVKVEEKEKIVPIRLQK